MARASIRGKASIVGRGRGPFREKSIRCFVCALLVAATAPFVSAAERFEVQDMDGHVHDVGAMLEAGTPVVLVFWQTWCASCKREAPDLATAIEQYGDSVSFFGVVSGPDDVIDDEEVRRVSRNWHLTHPQVRDRDLTLARRFDVRGTPVIIILGQGGREVFRGYRLPDDWSPFVSAPPA